MKDTNGEVIDLDDEDEVEAATETVEAVEGAVEASDSAEEKNEA